MYPAQMQNNGPGAKICSNLNGLDSILNSQRSLICIFCREMEYVSTSSFMYIRNREEVVYAGDLNFIRIFQELLNSFECILGNSVLQLYFPKPRLARLSMSFCPSLNSPDFHTVEMPNMIFIFSFRFIQTGSTRLIW